MSEPQTLVRLLWKDGREEVAQFSERAVHGPPAQDGMWEAEVLKIRVQEVDQDALHFALLKRDTSPFRHIVEREVLFHRRLYRLAGDFRSGSPIRAVYVEHGCPLHVELEFIEKQVKEHQ